MDIKKVIQDLESGTISTKATAEAFLDSYTPQEQKQIIAASGWAFPVKIAK